MAIETEIALIEAAIGGDADSFTQLCGKYYPAMVALADSVLGDRHLAEDAAQEAFAKACLKLDRLKKKDRFGWWMAAICRNIARDMARARKKTESIEDCSPAVIETRQDGLTESVREAIKRLSVSEREVIYLRYYDGLAYERMSEVLGISRMGIDGRLRRAKKKIAKHLSRNGFAEV